MTFEWIEEEEEKIMTSPIADPACLSLPACVVADGDSLPEL